MKKIIFEELLGSKARSKILKVLAQSEELTLSLLINKSLKEFIDLLEED